MLRPLRHYYTMRVRLRCVLLLARVSEGGVARARAVVFKNGPVAYTTLNEREFGDARGPDDRPVSESCAHCGVRGATSRCSRCRQVVYCGRACQAAAWGRHRKLCK